MIAMAEFHGDYITVTKAADTLRVNGTLIRRELNKHLDKKTGRSEGGRLSGYLLHKRTWMVKKQDVEAMASQLGWKAGKPREAKKPAAKRTAKKSR
jgi:hypothetical protein